jgi:hypothetical protein
MVPREAAIFLLFLGRRVKNHGGKGESEGGSA